MKKRRQPSNRQTTTATFSNSSRPWKPTKAEVAAAVDRTIPDVLAADLKVVFCGINPGLYSAAVGHHFGRPGNRFWPTLHQSGFTPRLLNPFEDGTLIQWELGITNVVSRATARADELSREEFQDGAIQLAEKMKQYQPAWLAVLGITAYRQAFERPKAVVGFQPEKIGPTSVWVLPNPSGLNAHYQLQELAELFAAFRERMMADDKQGRANGKKND